MRRLIWLFVLLALAWTGWWGFAAWKLRAGVDGWFQERRAEGWQAEAAELDTAGFPLDLSLTLTALALADPETGAAFETEALVVEAPAWWPGDITARLPGDSFQLASPLERRTVEVEAAQAALKLRPGGALELQQASIMSRGWSVASDAGTHWRAQGLEMNLTQDSDTAENYTFTARAPDFTPGGVVRQALRVPQDWPIAFRSLEARGAVLFDRPLDRRTVEDRRPQPRAITLDVAEAEWGTLYLRAAADLAVDETGLVSGEADLQARNWREMLDLAETSGTLPAALRPQVENVLTALARGSGNPEALDINLTIDDGVVFLGFIPLFRVAPLVVR